MLFTLTLVILLGAITVFFSQEFLGFFKKIFAIKGMKLFLPLFIASWLVFTFDHWGLWGIYYYRQILSYVLVFLVDIMPFSYMAEHVALIILLATISVLPVYLIDLSLRKRSFKRYQYPQVTSLFLFIVTSLVVLAL